MRWEPPHEVRKRNRAGSRGWLQPLPPARACEGAHMTGDVLRGAPPHTGSTAFINARIVDPAANAEYTGAILISDGKIADFGPNLFASGAPYGIESVDCRG